MEYAKGDFTKESLKIQRAKQQILLLHMKYLWHMMESSLI